MTQRYPIPIVTKKVIAGFRSVDRFISVRLSKKNKVEHWSSSMEKSEYSKKVEQQISQYDENEVIHDNPAIFHKWSWNFVRPGMGDVFGAESITDIYTKAAEEATSGFSRHCNILSVGCGDGDVEIEIAKQLISCGHSAFHITGLDISPILIDRFHQKVRDHGLREYIVPVAADLNQVSELGKFNVVMANHSLHHMLDLERVFDAIAEALEPQGIFATCDMIGRNGHMRWPEAEAVVQNFWQTLSERQRFNHQLRRLDDPRFVDHDCSNEGFEGIRAQDILPLILQRFRPYKFFGCGGFIDTFVGPGYGPGFDVNNEQDLSMVMALGGLNDMMLDAGMITPTVMIAYFTLDYRGERFFRDRRASSSVRDVTNTPSWVRHCS